MANHLRWYAGFAWVFWHSEEQRTGLDALRAFYCRVIPVDNRQNAHDHYGDPFPDAIALPIYSDTGRGSYCDPCCALMVSPCSCHSRFTDCSMPGLPPVKALTRAIQR